MSRLVRISIITVVKNDACNLEETILSVIDKVTTVKIDFIVIDGGSTDGTIDIIKKYAKYITFWVSEQDKGIYDAMNKGWSASASDRFILFLGAGDRLVFLPENMESYTYKDVIYGSVMIGENTVFIPRADFHLKIYNSLHHQALLVNKAIHPAPPFNCRYQIYADFDFNQRLKKNGANFVYTPNFIGYARPGGISDHKNFAESLRIVLANYGFLWASLALLGYYAMKAFPVFKRLRPVRDIQD